MDESGESPKWPNRKVQFGCTSYGKKFSNTEVEMGLVDCLYDRTEKYSMAVLSEGKSSVILKFDEPGDLMC